jgi:CBS domain-containing protein
MPETASAGSTPISTLESDTVCEIRPEATVLQIAAALDDADIGLLVVADFQTVLGVVSERDVVHSLAAGQDPAQTTAMEIAHTELAWADATATVAEVAEKMMEHYLRHVLVEKDGHLVGVVSARDLLGAYASADAYAD